MRIDADRTAARTGSARRSLVGPVLDQAESRPDAIALVEARREISYGRLAQDIGATAAGLQQHGITAGETVALVLKGSREEGYERVCCFYALNYLGAAVLPISPDTPPMRREQLLRAFGARALDPAQYVMAASGTKPARADDPERLSTYRFSTGSTGEPKAVVVSNAKYSAMQEATARALDFDATDRLLPPIPLPHPIGVRNMLRIHAAGGALVNEPLASDLQGLAETIRRHGVTRIVASPAQLRWLISRPAPPGIRMPPLRGIVTGGAPLLPSEHHAVRRILTPNLYVDYGAVDFSMIAVQRPGDSPEAGAELLPGMDAEVVGEDDRALPFGAAGQLRVRAPWAPAGYADRAGAPQYRNGWFYPGDLAILEPDRRIKLIGRADDIVNRGGVKIVPEAIESVLVAHPDVRDAALVGVPDSIAGELPVAFVVLHRPAALQGLQAFCREQIEERRLPAAFVAVSEIPRSPEGKVLRAKLRALVRAR